MDDSSDEEMSDLSSFPTLGTASSATHIYSIEDVFESDFLDDEEIVYERYRRIPAEDDESTYSDEDDDISLSSTISASHSSYLSHKEISHESLQKQGINYTKLDMLVLEYLYTKSIIAEHPLLDRMEFAANEHDRQLQKSMFLIRRLITSGFIEDAASKLHHLVPSYEQNVDLVFKINLQILMEMINRDRYTVQPSFVLNYCREVLVPKIAPPSSNYDEFRDLLPSLLLEPGKLPLTRVEKGRERLAFSIHTYLCDTLLQISETQSTFTLLMTHLFTIHNNYNFTTGRRSLFPDIDDLFSGKVPQEVFDESTVQNSTLNSLNDDIELLSQTLSISQKEAMNALKQCNGELTKAGRKELSRMRLHHDLLIQYAKDYCVFRGLLDSSFVDSSKYSSEYLSQIQHLRKIREAALVYDIQTIIDLTTAIDPEYFKEHVDSLFRLKQIEFLEYIKSGQFGLAIALSAEMRQLASTESLLHELRNTVLLLAFANDLESPIIAPVIEHIRKLDIIGPIVTHLSERLSLSQPTIIFLFKYLLYVHTSYKDEVSPDPFESMFELQILKDWSLEDQNQEEDFPVITETEHSVEESESSSDTSDDEDDEEDDEHDEPTEEERRIAVQQLMEIMRIDESRAEELLVSNRYSLDRVFRGIFGS